MKHFFTLAVLCGACAVTAQAQSVVIVDKDGLPHKFCTDYVKDITFVKQEPQIETEKVEFTNAAVDPYTNNATLTLTAADGSSLVLDIYTATDYNYFKAGTYTVQETQGDWIVLAGSESYRKKQGVDIPLKEGTVKFENDKAEYTISVDIILKNNTKIEGSYKGVLNDYSQYVDTKAAFIKQQAINDPVDGEFYFYIADNDYTWELRMDFFCSPDAKELTPGTYTFSETPVAGNFGPKSTLDSYRPSYNSKVQGSATITADGDNTKANMLLTLANGRVYNVTFDGKIQYLEAPKPQLPVFSSIKLEPYSYGNVTITLTDADGNNLVLDCYGPETAQYLMPGTYNVATTDNEWEIMIKYSSYETTLPDDKTEKREIKSGSLVVSRDGLIYTLTADITLEDDSKVTGVYTGELPAYSPLTAVTATDASQGNINDPIPGEFYIKVHDDNYTFDGQLDFFADADATTLPAGSYTFSETPTPGTYGPKTQITLYSPNKVFEVRDTTVTVTEADGKTIINFEMNTADGQTFKFDFNGEIKYLNK